MDWLTNQLEKQKVGILKYFCKYPLVLTQIDEAHSNFSLSWEYFLKLN